MRFQVERSVVSACPAGRQRRFKAEKRISRWRARHRALAYSRRLTLATRHHLDYRKTAARLGPGGGRAVAYKKIYIFYPTTVHMRVRTNVRYNRVNCFRVVL